MLKSATWFYSKLRADLDADSLIVNDYDPFVTNKIINGTQMIVT